MQVKRFQEAKYVYLIGVSKVARYEISTALFLRHVIWHFTLCIGVNRFPCSIVRILEVFQTLEEVGMQCLEERNPIYEHFLKLVSLVTSLTPT